MDMATEGKPTGSGEKGRVESTPSKKLSKMEKKTTVEKVFDQDPEALEQMLVTKREGLNEEIRKLRLKTERKLVAKKKHKEVLDEFVEETEKKAKRILEGGGSEVERYQKLEELKEKRTEELQKKMEEWKKSEGETEDKEFKKSAKKVEDKDVKAAAQQLVEGMISLTDKVSRLEKKAGEVEKAKVRFDQSRSAVARMRLKNRMGEFVDQYNEVSADTNRLLVQVDTLELEELALANMEYDYQLKIESLIKDSQKEVGGMKQVVELEDKIKLLETRSDVKGVQAGEDDLKKTVKQIDQLKEKNKISEEVAETMKQKLLKLRETDLRKEQISTREASRAAQAIRAKGKEVPKGTNEQLAEFLRNNPGMEKLPEKEQRELAWLEDPTVRRILDEIGVTEDHQPPAQLADEWMRRVERDPGSTDEAVEVIELANGFMDGDFTKIWNRYAKAVESPFRPDRLLDDAKREIVMKSLERIKREGKDAKKAVTDADVREWVLEQMNRVIAGGEEATGYSARQFISEVSGILEKKDLQFDEIIDDMTRNVKKGSDIRSRSGAELDDETHYLLIESRGLFEEVDGADYQILSEIGKNTHIDRADDDFRDEIGAAIVIHELSNAYGRSGSVEDMMRISSGVDTEKFAWVLEMKSPERRVEGRLKFYEVDVDPNTNKRKVLDRGDFEDGVFNEETIKQIHTAEISKGGLSVVVKKPDGSMETIGFDDFENLLQVQEDKVSIQTGDMLDIMNQERFAVGSLSRRKGVKDKFEKESVREAISYSMGLVDVDGEVNWDKVQDLIVAKYGQGASFELTSRVGENLARDSKRVRMKVVMSRVGDKVMAPHTEMPREVPIEVGGVTTYLGGVREDNKGFDDMMNEYKMNYKLADGIWGVTGLAAGHWSKDHSGECKDWHMKVIHFIKYVQMYGIGPPHLRKAVNLDFHDFITRRKGDIIPELYGDHTMTDESLPKGFEIHDAKMHRKELIKMLVEDRDGYVMSRQRMLDIFGHEDVEKIVKPMLMEKAKHLWGGPKAEMIVNRHWKAITEINWKSVIEGGEDMGDSVTVGFKGLSTWVKKHYRYADLNWGKGGKSGDNTWAQRWYKEMQYLMSAEKFRGGMMGWLIAKPKSPEAIMEATSAAGWYGQTDQNRKNALMLQAYREYFGSVGAGWAPWGLKTVEADPYSLSAKDPKTDQWDGSIRYGEKTVTTGRCLAKEERGIGPLDSNQFAEIVEQMQRAGKLTANVAHELHGRVAEAGWVQEWISSKVDRWPPGLKQGAKFINFALLGGHVPSSKHLPILKFLPWEIYAGGRMAGIVGWIWKKIRQWVVDTWAVRREIRQEMLKTAGEQVASIAKVD